MAQAKGGRALAGILASAPPPALPAPSYQTEDQEGSISGSCPEDSKGSQSPSEFLLTLEAEQAAVDGCYPDTVTWPGFFPI